VEIERHPLGKLTGHGTAEFFAVIARDPADPKAIAKGLEIELKDGTRHARIYADEETLAQWELDIERTDSRKDQIVKQFQERDPRQKARWLTGVQDYAKVSLNQPGEWADVPQVGLYGIDASHEIGVFILVFRRSGRGRYYFPGAELTTVADFIAAARKWLEVH
jgi:hypothetical protein